MNLLHHVARYAVNQKMGRSLKWEEPSEISPRQRPGKSFLYIHVPFCEHICPFCMFNAHKLNRESSQVADYFDALKKELLMYKQAGFDFGAAYVGGGTPALVHEELAEFLEFTRKHFDLAEISVEANPHVSDAAVDSFLAVGVDRFSIGVQSFDDGMLKKLGREGYGSGEQIRERINQLLGKFRILNIDFIFNVPDHDPEILARDLDIAVADKVDQLTTYPLMEAQQNRSYVSRQGRISYDLEAKLYKQVILPKLREHYTPVSSWCFSRKDKPEIDMLDEYVVDYFDYVGIGTGSMSLHDSRVQVNAYTLPLYERMVNSGKLPLVLQTYELPRRDYMLYYLMMALFGRRLSFKRFEEVFGVPFKRAMWLEWLGLKALDLVYEKDGYVYTNERGMYVFLMILREFFTHVNRFRSLAKLASHKLEEAQGAAKLTFEPLASGD